MSKKIETLVDDIYGALNKLNSGEKITDDDTLDRYITIATANIGNALRNQLKPREGKRKPKAIYASEAGKPCHRAVWYAINEADREPLPPEVKIKFMQGDLLEELLALLSRVAGHEVTDEQKRIKIELPNDWFISGKMDYKIDGVIVDAKSASNYAFSKFADGSLSKPGNDSFGYMAQLANYVIHEGEVENDAGFLAINKQSCEICLYQPDPMDLMAAMPDHEVMVNDLESPIGPDREYHDEADGSSGNRILGNECSWCDFKQVCWSDSNRGKGLRSFWKKEWNGYKLKHYTQVVKEPRLKEEFK
jgi:hypothetical protein